LVSPDVLSSLLSSVLRRFRVMVAIISRDRSARLVHARFRLRPSKSAATLTLLGSALPRTLRHVVSTVGRLTPSWSYDISPKFEDF